MFICKIIKETIFLLLAIFSFIVQLLTMSVSVLKAREYSG